MSPISRPAREGGRPQPSTANGICPPATRIARTGRSEKSICKGLRSRYESGGPPRWAQLASMAACFPEQLRCTVRLRPRGEQAGWGLRRGIGRRVGTAAQLGLGQSGAGRNATDAPPSPRSPVAPTP